MTTNVFKKEDDHFYNEDTERDNWNLGDYIPKWYYDDKGVKHIIVWDEGIELRYIWENGKLVRIKEEVF